MEKTAAAFCKTRRGDSSRLHRINFRFRASSETARKTIATLKNEMRIPKMPWLPLPKRNLQHSLTEAFHNLIRTESGAALL
jgi:hypothetical protein